VKPTEHTSVKVYLPKQLPSRLTTLQKACTAAQFEVNPAGCPAASLVGHAPAVIHQSTPVGVTCRLKVKQVKHGRRNRSTKTNKHGNGGRGR
jgi:hypothetical protein